MTSQAPRSLFKSFVAAVWKLLVVLALYLGLSDFCNKRTDTFTIAAISSNRPFDPQWQTRPLSSEELSERDTALSQKYRYFGKGGQCYAFFSEDGKYVIKFFKQRVYTIPLWHHFIPIPYVFDRYKDKKRWKRQDKLQRDFFSYKVAFEDLKEMTGILYVHLNPTKDLKRSITIVDLLNIEHHLDLDQFDFILQKRADMIYPTITTLLKEGQIDPIKQIIEQVVDQIDLRCHRGYEDWDPNVRTNCGLLNDRVIKIDVGRFIHNEKMKTPEMRRSELVRITTPFKEWLKTQEPLLASYCDEAVARAIDE
jgi:hypothetical protein